MLNPSSLRALWDTGLELLHCIYNTCPEFQELFRKKYEILFQNFSVGFLRNYRRYENTFYTSSSLFNSGSKYVFILLNICSVFLPGWHIYMRVEIIFNFDVFGAEDTGCEESVSLIKVFFFSKAFWQRKQQKTTLFFVYSHCV